MKPYKILFLALLFVSIFTLGCGDRESLNLLNIINTEITDPSATDAVTDLPDEVWQILENNSETEEIKQAQRVYYNRYIDADGVAIIGNDIVPDEVFIAAKNAFLIMTSKHPQLRAPLREQFYFVIAPSPSVPEDWNPFPSFCSIMREGRLKIIGLNPTDDFNDPEVVVRVSILPTISLTPSPDIKGYCVSGIYGINPPSLQMFVRYHLHTFVHEAAHAIHLVLKDVNVIEELMFDHTYHVENEIGIDVDNLFDSKLRAAYENAIEKDLWDGYIETNFREYWAELVRIWFFEVGEDRVFKTTEELEAHDPLGTALVKEWFPQVTLPHIVSVGDSQ
ncbi:MAG: hypothetical protein OXI67_11400 [Candidatus Poribacteria bacterium]|nr:hypothetical protein [Candidatus Poribacteria bacterium]